MKEKIFRHSPLFIQNLMVTGYNLLEYRKRYGGNYKKYRKELRELQNLSLAELKQIQENELQDFLNFVYKNAAYYKELIPADKITDLTAYPIVSKEDFRKDIKSFITIDPNEAIISKTGGTTGKSLKVYYTYDDMQKRFAFLDDFRSRFGYELGKKTAWFSGKTLLNEKDIQVNRFWKTDYWHKVKYYSTFHIKTEYMPYYIENLKKFKPEYMVGFPSSMLEIAKYGLKNNIDFPKGIKAVFPTAETVTDETRRLISEFFKTDVYDQYASSEGAPFIFECKNHKLHLELQSGVFEVLDEQNQPTESGRLVLTSFTTHGTPLVRYDIGDVLTLSDESCNCGNQNPVIARIEGRIDDYIYSPENGKINLGNVSNTLKNTDGIIKFQAIQDELDKITVLIETDPKLYSDKIEGIFLQNWRERVGESMKIQLIKTDSIAHEASGKFRIVKNNIKHLID
ncbi:MAG: phenylacetate--CoA ligase family protein [Flavobacteriaceae bacterium]|nr:phenylacetate--CoA ligase family protein [Flavobacteriaceae bacterium]